MNWKNKSIGILPVLSWCREPGEKAMSQIANLANHPALFSHVAVMPDCHVGYGMPIGAVIACRNALIPNAVGVDIGCGMRTVRTEVRRESLGPELLSKILHSVKRSVPVGEGAARNNPQHWEPFEELLADLPGGANTSVWELARRNLGTLGGGNHFIEIQGDESGSVWLMIHSGSRNLGYRIAEHHHKIALNLDRREGLSFPDPELAWLPADSQEGAKYARDMGFALEYAKENRRRIMDDFKSEFERAVGSCRFESEFDIHHNYASHEIHFGERVWIHRKGATSAVSGEKGIIPGSMGSSSYIVEGLGNADSFSSSSHGAGRKMSRSEACGKLSLQECEKAMEGIVFDGFKAAHSKFGGKMRKKNSYDLEEAPQAYKDIEDVISSEADLVRPIHKLSPIGVIKG